MDKTIYMPASEALVVTGERLGSWLHAHGAPMYSRWYSNEILPDGGRVWRSFDEEAMEQWVTEVVTVDG